MASASAALGATGSGGGFGDVGEGVGALPLRVERFSDGRRVKNEAIAAATAITFRPEATGVARSSSTQDRVGVSQTRRPCQPVRTTRLAQRALPRSQTRLVP